MNVLSLFDGISCGRLALDKAGIEYNKYYSSEIDKNALKVSRKNFPDNIELGDVRDIKEDFDSIDLLLGGSPCQSFSFMGDGTGFDGKSGLFLEFVRLYKALRPKYFLFENVKMKKEWSDKISDLLGMHPIEINSKHFVPQNRPRLYWTNIPLHPIRDGKRLCIANILQDEVDDRYYLTDAQISKLNLNFDWNENEIIKHVGGRHQGDVIYRYDGLMGCLCTSTHGQAPHLTKTYLPNGKIRRLTEIECERLQSVPDGFTDCEIASSKRYELLGNGWTVDVISHLLSGIKDNHRKVSAPSLAMF
jgi:DNA (cytosine-5)-methyltransferase 3A